MKLINPEQKFCQECGRKVPQVSESSTIKPASDMPQYLIHSSTDTTISSPPQHSPVLTSQKFMRYNMTIENSKKSLCFGLPSFLIALIALITLPAFPFFPDPVRYVPIINLMLPALDIHGFGLLFAILGTNFSSKARKFELENSM
jgi:hypothetical protein